MSYNGSMKVNSDSGDDSYRTSKSGPTRHPKRDFRKVLGKERREGRDDNEKGEVHKEDKEVKGKESYKEVAEKLNIDEQGPKKGVSLFDLAGAKKEEAVEQIAEAEAEELPVSELSKEVLKESLSALFKGYGSKERLRAIQEEIDRMAVKGEHALGRELAKELAELSPEARNQALKGIIPAQEEAKAGKEPMVDLAADKADNGPKSVPVAEEGKSASKFTQDQPDLAGINPLAGQPAARTGQVQAPQPASPAASRLQEIVDQIIDKLTTVSTTGRTDTMVKLKHPPLFAGTSVVITSFDTAKGEFNVTFENLTQAAKQMLDLKENQDALKFALEQKGYTVHIITTTTLSETTELAEGRPTEQEEGDEAGAHSRKDEREETEE